MQLTKYLNMPHMNGLEMVAAVKSQALHAALPILMLTTEGQASAPLPAFGCVVSSRLQKQVDPMRIVY